MRITYIHHSSFLVEMEHAALLFDYFEGELPPLADDKPLVIFASHRHGDHFAPVIFQLAQGRKNVQFVLSDDIWKRQVPQEYLGCTTFIGPQEERTVYLTPESRNEPGNILQVWAYKSTDEGVAFLIRTLDKTIYHAGDLNNWVWEGEPEADNRRMSERYHEELKKLAGAHIDVAFVPLDPRQEKDFYLGMDDFMRMVGAKTVFPMHFWGDFDVIRRFKELPCTAGYRERIRDIRSKGETFALS